MGALHFAPRPPGIHRHRVLLVETDSAFIRCEVRALHGVPGHVVMAIVETIDDIPPAEQESMSLTTGETTTEEVEQLSD